jgi:membrane-associated phospholipid phosphatase
LVPAIGPVYTLHDQYTVPLGQSLDIFNQQMQFMDFARIQRDVFPSMHTAVSFIVWLYAYRNSRRLFVLLAPFILSLWASTVYLRYHYLVDVVAGLILAPLCFLAANWMFKRFGMLQLPLPSAWSERWARRRIFQKAADGAEHTEERG